MSQELKDHVVVGPDAETQLIEKQSGRQEIRCRSDGSQALVVRNRRQAVKLIEALARFARELE